MRREWKTTEIKKVQNLYEAGLNHSQISDEIGRPWSSIKYVIWKHGMKRNPMMSGVSTVTGVGAFFCAAHRDKQTGQLHGHTWDVIAWFKSNKDAVTLQAELKAVLQVFDHTELPEELAWGEAIAVEIMRLLADCVEVEVRRESERIYAKASRRGYLK